MDEVLYVPTAARSAHGRGAERRRGASALLQSVIRALSVASGPASVRERFEQELRSMVRARAVADCEGWSAPKRASCWKRRRMSPHWCWRSSARWADRRCSRASDVMGRRRSSGPAGPSVRCASASSKLLSLISQLNAPGFAGGFVTGRAHAQRSPPSHRWRRRRQDTQSPASGRGSHSPRVPTGGWHPEVG